MTEAVIVATARTPIGRAFKGSLIDVRPDDMGAFIVRALLNKIPQLNEVEIDDVIFGAANHAGEQSMNMARNIAALAGLPDSVPGTTVNRFCASSLQSIRMAFHAIKASEGEIFVAGGVESTTRTLGVGLSEQDFNPRFTDKSRSDYVNDMYISMGLTAENVAAKYRISRHRMDEFAKLSQDRAVKSQLDGFFDREITPYPLHDGHLITKDDGPRPNTDLEKLGQLPPAFLPDGIVTAGNSCPLNDGAAAVLVMSDDKAKRLGITPLARIVASSVTGLAPEIMGVGPIEAVKKVLSLARMTLADIGIVELNEAFASQVLAVCDELSISIEDQLNPHGGAIALGHPFGMTGARIMTTLLNGLKISDKQFGLETMCVGGGMGMAMIVERLS